MASGEEHTLTAARPVLEAMGSKIEWISQKVGDGQSMKLVNQLLCGVHLAAAGEALAFARALGLNPRRSYEVVRQGAANSFMLDDLGRPHVERRPGKCERARSTSLSKTPGWYWMPLERTGSSPTWRSRRTRSSRKVLSPEWEARTIRVWRRSIATGSQVSSSTAHEVTSDRGSVKCNEPCSPRGSRR